MATRTPKWQQIMSFSYSLPPPQIPRMEIAPCDACHAASTCIDLRQPRGAWGRTISVTRVCPLTVSALGLAHANAVNGLQLQEVPCRIDPEQIMHMHRLSRMMVTQL
jgi:hypothetical protein